MSMYGWQQCDGLNSVFCIKMCFEDSSQSRGGVKFWCLCHLVCTLCGSPSICFRNLSKSQSFHNQCAKCGIVQSKLHVYGFKIVSWHGEGEWDGYCLWCHVSGIEHIPVYLVLFITLLSGFRARLNQRGIKESPWNIPHLIGMGDDGYGVC